MLRLLQSAIFCCLLCCCRKPAPTIAELRAADKDWQRPNQIAFADPRKPAWLLVFDGDSITVGHGLKPEQSYPALVVASFKRKGENIDAFNMARCFDTTKDLIERSGKIDALTSRRRYARAVLVAWAGTNDLVFGDQPEPVGARIESYIHAREHVFNEVLYIAPMPRYAPGTPSAFESNRQRLIGILGPVLHPVGSPELLDRVHLSSEGAISVARDVQSMIYANAKTAGWM